MFLLTYFSTSHARVVKTELVALNGVACVMAFSATNYSPF